MKGFPHTCLVILIKWGYIIETAGGSRGTLRIPPSEVFFNSFHSPNSELNMAELKEHKRGSNSTSKRKSRDVPPGGGSGASQSSYFERQPFRVGFSGLFVLQNSTTQSSWAI